MYARKRLDCLEELVGRNMDIKDNSNEVSEGNKQDDREITIILEITYIVIIRMLLDM